MFFTEELGLRSYITRPIVEQKAVITIKKDKLYLVIYQIQILD